jgi:outer membrane protein assembly factor BamB
MTSSIFCPQNHLILAAQRCVHCGWERPIPGDIGETIWGPTPLNAGLGGPGRSVFAAPAVAQEVAAFPLRDGELVGVDLATGETRWRFALDAGRMTRSLVPDPPSAQRKGQARFLAAISDERSLDQAGNGRLVAIYPNSGKMTSLWEADSHQISPPVLTPDLVLVRTSKSELVALSRATKPTIVWRQPLNAWWALSPFVAGNMVLVSDGRAMHGEGQLRALALETGEILWEIATDGMLTHPPVCLGDTLIFRNGRRQLMGIGLADGEIRWQQEYPRIYSAPIAGNECVYLTVRGAAPVHHEGHYQLQALNPPTGETHWTIPLPARVRIGTYVEETAILLGSDTGQVLAYHPEDGKALWDLELSSKEDPIRTELVVHNQLLLGGTYYGQIFAVRVAAPPTDLAAPDEYIAAGEFEKAAAVYALRGDFHRAADIYVQELDEVDKAFSLLEYGQLYQEAGELARDLDQHSQAERYFDLAGNQLAVAEQKIAKGDHLGAAPLYEPKDLKRAAELYEQGGDLRKAFDIYLFKLLDWKEVRRLRPDVKPEHKDIKKFEEEGKYLEAGDVALALNMLEKAVKMFEKAGEKEREFDALLELIQERPETWSLERMADLSRGMGKFQQEAEAWKQLNRDDFAAKAYHRAAQQKERTDPENESAIAELYEKACQSYVTAGLEDQESICDEKVIYYRQLPKVVIEVFVNATFKEDEFNRIKLIIRNIGRGRADFVSYQIGKGRFEVGESGIRPQFNLAAGVGKELELSVRPELRQIGEAVPLVIEWTWYDEQNQQYTDLVSITVVVRRKDDSRPSGGEIHIHGGTLIQQADHVVHGDHVEGDQIGGDKLDSGAQKGDKVEIQRGQGVRMIGEGQEPPDSKSGPSCPNCHLDISPDDQFCQSCGFELISENGGEMK